MTDSDSDHNDNSGDSQIMALTTVTIMTKHEQQ